jgi:serine/threonine protein kinase/Flp pilus assembly protein TadD
MQEQSLFIEALERVDRAERDAFLDRACAGDPALRQRIERLLQRHEQVDNFLESPAAAWVSTVEEPLTERPGTVIGPYKLLEQIGEGGMGLVFVAEQQQPVKRRVALKVIKPGMDSQQVIARFEAERQALAIMDHPNIAKVHDGGRTPDGRPYFVMEFVKGLPITAYCDQHRLTTRQRLALFVDVCRAVQHAHQKGIIHRDLKPSNILVAVQDVTAVVKVIDFGIAKAIGGQLTDKTLYTQVAQLVGTPLYVSPEQAGLSSLDVDTRSDVYSLGVLLYELLTGTTPFEGETFQQAGYDEMRRIIREEEPPTPSARLSTMQPAHLSTIAACRAAEPRKLSQQVRGELDWVVMKALEKDRNRRYESASAFAADVQRYLADEPLEASPPSALYRLKKLVRRHKAALVMAGLVALAAVAIAGSAGYVFHDRSTRKAVLAARVNDALDESERLYRDGKVPEALNAARRAANLLDTGPTNEALTARVRERVVDLKTVLQFDEALFKTTIGERIAEFERLFRTRGIDLRAQPAEEAAARIRGQFIAADLATMLDLWVGTSNWSEGRKDAWTRKLMAIARQADPDPWRDQARRAFDLGDTAALEELARTAPVEELPPATLRTFAVTVGRRDFLRRAQRRYPSDVWVNYLLADSLYQREPHDYQEAAGFFRILVALRPNSPLAHVKVADVLQVGGKRDEALAMVREAARVNAQDPPGAHFACGNWLRGVGRLEEAIVEYKEALRLMPNLPMAHYILGAALWQKGRPDEAISEFKEHLRLQPDHVSAHVSLGNALADKGRLDEAIAEFKEALRLEPDSSNALHNLCIVLADVGRLDEAIACYREALRLQPNSANALNSQAWVLATASDAKYRNAPLAVELARKAVELEPGKRAFLNTLGVAHYHAGASKDAIAALEKSRKLCGGGDSFDFFFLAMAHWQLGEKDQARDWYAKAVAWMEKNQPKDLALTRFRAEAAELLGIKTSQPAKEKPATKP